MKLTEGGRLERPNICWICKRTPEIGTPVIDTEKHFDGYPFDVNGRQYVCENCAVQMAGFFDLASREEVRLAKYEAVQAQAILRGLKQRLDSVIEDLRNVAQDPNKFISEVADDVREPEDVGAGTDAPTDADGAGRKPRARKSASARATASKS